MTRDVRVLTFLFFSTLLVFSGCAGGKEIRTVPSQAQAIQTPVTEGAPVTTPVLGTAVPEEVEYRLGINDVVGISVYGYPDMTRAVSVKKDGKIYLPLVGGIPVEGLTVEEARDRVSQELGRYLRRPQVELEIKEYASRLVLVLGAVAKAGVIPLVRDTTLLDAVTLAGGVHSGSLAEVFLLRKGKISVYDLLAIFERGDMSQNIILQNRDVVYVPLLEDRKVFVLGRVERPGIVPMASSRLGLVEVIAAAGGFKVGAVSDDVRVIRGGLTSPTMFSFDMDRILKGKGLDGQGFTLASGDIVYVPDSILTSWNKIIEQIKPTIDLLALPVNTISSYLIIRNFTKTGTITGQ